MNTALMTDTTADGSSSVLDQSPASPKRYLGTKRKLAPPKPPQKRSAPDTSPSPNSAPEHPVSWGLADPKQRGPVICSDLADHNRNAIGAHSGPYSIYRALAVVSGKLEPKHTPDFTLTVPPFQIGPHPSWSDDDKIVTMDPFGATVQQHFAEELAAGVKVRPTIAITQAHIDVPEILTAMSSGRLLPDGKVLLKDGKICVGKAAIEPCWHLPGVAKRFGVSEQDLRQALFTHTNGAYPELLTRPELKVFLPPIGGQTIYIFGDIANVSDPSKELTVRVHDECNGSDVFGSDICTCRPYLTHAIEECVKTAQQGGAGVCIYYRKEGRCLGEVTKYLVYNMRKRQKGGDTAEEYFNCTKKVAGIEDVRFQQLMTDPLHWLGITKIDKLVSMSDMKYDAIVGSGIEVKARVPIPPELVPADAQVEINAKVFAGYNGGSVYEVDEQTLKQTKGREYNAQ